MCKFKKFEILEPVPSECMRDWVFLFLCIFFKLHNYTFVGNSYTYKGY